MNTLSRLGWTFEEIPTSDHHLLRINFSAVMRPPETAADRQLFTEIFGPVPSDNGPRIIQQHLQPAIRQSVAQLVASRDAAHWLSDAGQRELSHTLRQAGDAAAFACGISLIPPCEVNTDSPTLRQRELEQIRQRQANDVISDQLKQAELAIEVLQKFEALRREFPNYSDGNLLERMASPNPGKTLQTLLMGQGAAASARIWLICGPELLHATLPANGGPDGSSHPISLQPLANFADTAAAAVGPLRSINPVTSDNHTRFLLGARNGIIEWDHSCAEIIRVLHDTHAPWRMGYSRAACFGERIWACHAEAGLTAWEPQQPDTPITIINPATLRTKLRGESDRVGHLTRLDDTRAIFSLDSMLALLDTTTGTVAPLPSTGDARIVQICDEGPTLAVIHEDGCVARLDRTTLEVTDQSRPCGRIISAGLLPWMGSRRLLLASEEGPIFCAGRDDSVVSQYRSAYRGLTMVSATPGWIGGIAPDRRRIILWRSWQGNTPAIDLTLSAISRHRIADLILL